MMNCGFRSDASSPPLPDETNGELHCYELYGRRVADTPLAGRDVLELGAGRGGGANYLHRFYAPRRMVALDYAAPTVRWCRRRFAQPGLEFVCGDAGASPFPDASFDMIVAVEVTHCLTDKPRCLAAVVRVLRPGGRLLVADFFTGGPMPCTRSGNSRTRSPALHSRSLLPTTGARA
jgi:ubiquinone/menaquinone biosynthesis C-methylase UbiE